MRSDGGDFTWVSERGAPRLSFVEKGGAKASTSQRRRHLTAPAENDCAISGQSQAGASLHQT